MKTVIAIIAISLSTLCYANKSIDSKEFASVESFIKAHGTPIAQNAFEYSMLDSNGNSHILTLTTEGKITVWTMFAGVKEGERSFLGWEIHPREVKLQIEEKGMDGRIEVFWEYMLKTLK